MKTLKDSLDHLQPDANRLLLGIVSLSEALNQSAGSIIDEQGLQNGNILFLEKGLARLFYFNERGEEVTAWLIKEANFVSYIDLPDRVGFSEYQLSFIEDSLLYSISWEDLFGLIDKDPSLSRQPLRVILKYLLFWQERSYILQFHTAEERYNRLMESDPDLFLRVPLHYIASYLNMRPATLSRLRSNVMRKTA